MNNGMLYIDTGEGLDEEREINEHDREFYYKDKRVK